MGQLLYNAGMQVGKRISEGRTAELFAVGPWVLKLLRPGFSRDAVLAEAHKAQVAAAAGLPAPAPLAILEQDSQPGILFQRVSGPTMLELMLTKPWSALSYARKLAHLHALIHSKRASGLVSFKQRLQSAIEDTELKPRLKAAALNMLSRLPMGNSLCHGDFHPGNIILTEEQPVIIDWLDASQGDPLGDVARTKLLFTIPPLTLPNPQKILVNWLRAAALRAYLRQYFLIRPEGQSRLDDCYSVALAARLSERIPGEAEAILKHLEKRLIN